jgi:hypothetical protein
MNQKQLFPVKQIPAAPKPVTRIDQDPPITVSLGDKIYKVGPKTLDSMIATAKEKYRKLGQCAIVAVGKDNVWTMEKTVFPDRASLDRGIQALQARGMQVRSVRV